MSASRSGARAICIGWGTGGDSDDDIPVLGLDGSFFGNIRELQVVAPSDMIAYGDATDPGFAFSSAISPAAGHVMGDGFSSFGPSTRHLGGANILFCDGHAECGRKRKWVEHRDDVMRRWNRDHQPHPESWTVNLMEYDY